MRILLIIMLLTSTAYADSKCGAAMTEQRYHTRVERGSYCMNFTVSFPWRRCNTKVCWRGSKSYPYLITGVACGTRVRCVRQGNSNSRRYACRY